MWHGKGMAGILLGAPSFCSLNPSSTLQTQGPMGNTGAGGLGLGGS